MKAVILAAGRGTRLKPLTDTLPKPLVPIGDESILEHLLNTLPKYIDDIHIVIGYLGDRIKKAVGNEWEGAPVTYHVQEELNGTGGAMELVQGVITEPTLVINADDLYLREDLEELTKHQLAMLVSLVPSARSNTIRVEDGEVKGFNSLPFDNTGAYMIDPRYFEFTPAEIPVRDHVEISLPHTLIQAAQTYHVAAVEASFWQPVGTLSQLEAAREVLNDA